MTCKCCKKCESCKHCKSAVRKRTKFVGGRMGFASMDTNVHECRINPPVVDKGWPEVNTTDSCSKWESNDQSN